MSFPTFPDHVSRTYEWLTADRAAAIGAIAKSHGAKVQRLAQSRTALGVCKVTVTVRKHSWAASNEVMGRIKTDLAAAGLGG
jgi:hypothetical protein